MRVVPEAYLDNADYGFHSASLFRTFGLSKATWRPSKGLCSWKDHALLIDNKQWFGHTF